jgi:thiol-disulfide isomerase/thioredoxin
VVAVRRRDFVAGALGLVAVGGGAAYLQRSRSDSSVEPVEVETLDAPGSKGGVTEVPRPGEVTFVEFFATWCKVCKGMMDDVGAVHDQVGDSVQFVSVSNEPVGHTVTRDDVVEWWEKNDGDWTVGVDPDLTLTDALGTVGVPATVVLDADNRIISADTGRKTTEEILTDIQEAR